MLPRKCSLAALLAFVVVQVFADRAVTSIPPRVTPSLSNRPSPSYLPITSFAHLRGASPAVVNSTNAKVVNATAAVAKTSNVTARDIGEVLGRRMPLDLAEDSLEGRTLVYPSVEKRATTLTPAQVASVCVDSSANDVYISSLFYYAGAGTTVYLCQNAVIRLTNAVFFYAADQTLTTWGNPTAAQRATLLVTGQNQACAVYGAVAGANRAALKNIQVNGSRQYLGLLAGGLALIEMGGDNTGQKIDNVHAWEPRGWSCLHAVGPSGHAPSGAQQFRRDSTGTYGPGQWADGISLACKGSLVQGNQVTDATDGGIVVFGAPGSYIYANTIISSDRQLLGGINMVDWAPFSGSFTGTQVTQNAIIANTNFIKVGVAIGTMTWGTDNRTIARTFGGSVTNNMFYSGTGGGYFGYAIAIAGHNGVTVSGNSAVPANFGSIESSSCFTALYPLPTPQSFIADRWTTPGAVLQGGFTFSTIALPVCRGPSKVTKVGGVAG